MAQGFPPENSFVLSNLSGFGNECDRRPPKFALRQQAWPQRISVASSPLASSLTFQDLVPTHVESPPISIRSSLMMPRLTLQAGHYGLRWILTGILSLGAFPDSVFAQEHYYFYKPAQTRGTDAYFSPLNLLLNGSFDALRTDPGNNRDLRKMYFTRTSTIVWYNLRDPLARINAYGWKRFWREEFINLSFDIEELQFLPNVGDHTLGYGMLYAKVTEYYDAHHYPSPVLWGIGTSLVFHYVNEMMQSGYELKVNVDHIADVYVFNTLGFVLFSFDGVKRFFSEDVQLLEWSLQPLLVPRNWNLQNVGQQFVLRYRLPWAERYAPFIYWGVNSVVGLSYRYDDRQSLSLGVGQSVNGMERQARGDFWRMVPRLDGAAGIFWDDNGSLLAGMVVTGPKVPNVQLNVYPGLVDLWGIQPGAYVGMGKRDKFVAGITFMSTPISLGFMQ
jgi:hypothetical protein